MTKEILCPVCLKNSDEFEYHHVFWKMDGGTDDIMNILEICKTCHVILTRGNTKDRLPRDVMCFYYQLGTYGLPFLLKSGAIHSNIAGFGSILVDRFKGNSVELLDDNLKRVAQKRYRECRELISGNMEWEAWAGEKLND